MAISLMLVSVDTLYLHRYIACKDSSLFSRYQKAILSGCWAVAQRNNRTYFCRCAAGGLSAARYEDGRGERAIDDFPVMKIRRGIRESKHLVG